MRRAPPAPPTGRLIEVVRQALAEPIRPHLLCAAYKGRRVLILTVDSEQWIDPVAAADLAIAGAVGRAGQPRYWVLEVVARPPEVVAAAA